jgi:hypothetical protein
MLQVTTYAASTFFVAVMVYSLAVVLFLGSKEHSPRAFSLPVAMLATWVLCAGFEYYFADTGNLEIAAIFVRLAHLFGTFIAITIFYFSLTYPNNYKPVPAIRWFFILSAFFVTVLYFAKDISALFGSSFVSEQTIIIDTYVNPGNYLGWHFGNLAIFFHIFFTCFWSLAMATLWQRYKQQTDPILQKQAWSMFWALTAGIVPAGFANVALPGAGVFGLFWYGLMSSFGWVSIMAYSILKQNQMNVKTGMTELFIIGTILIVFIGLFV